MTFDAAVQDERWVGKVTRESVDARIVERRYLAVFSWAKSREPGFASMNDERGASAPADGVDVMDEVVVGVEVGSMPMRHLTVTGREQASRIAETQRATVCGLGH